MIKIDLHNGGWWPQMREGGFGFCGAAGQDHHCAPPTWLDAATPPHGWMRLREPMQHSAVGHGSGRVRSICCYDHAVYLCVVNAIAFLCCRVGYNSIAIIITTFNKTCGM